MLESGRRWLDEDIPTTSWDVRKFAWQPEAEMYGIQRMEFLDDVLVLCGAGVGGGSHVYGNTLYVPPKKFFDAPEWAGITDWAGELAPYIDQATRMLGVVRVPLHGHAGGSTHARGRAGPGEGRFLQQGAGRRLFRHAGRGSRRSLFRRRRTGT